METKMECCPNCLSPTSIIGLCVACRMKYSQLLSEPYAHALSNFTPGSIDGEITSAKIERWRREQESEKKFNRPESLTK